jgi:hypothetical protein
VDEAGTVIDSFAMSGTYGAVLTSDQGGKYYDTCSETVSVVDLVSGAARRPVCAADCVQHWISSLVVGASGDAGWHVATSSVASTSTPFSEVACPSVSLCVATDPAGNIATSENPTGGAGAWTLTPSVGGAGIGCASTTLCVAVNA